MGLAGPRNRQKIGIDPRNTTWGNDTTRYGFRLLAGLGWKAGNGLGRTQSGSNSNIKIALKEDKLGIGCKYPGHDDWNGLQNLERLFARINGREIPVFDLKIKVQEGEYILGRGSRAMKFIRGEVWQSDFKGLKTDNNCGNDNVARLERRARREQRRIKAEKRVQRKLKNYQAKEQRKLRICDLPNEPPRANEETVNPVVSLCNVGRLSHRAKFLKHKKAATMNVEALREILGTACA